MDGRISVETQTTYLKPGQKYVFRVRFDGMEPCKLKYSLTGYDSGTITEAGEYTAPNREGSFEVHISCDGNPGISTYGYVNVRE